MLKFSLGASQFLCNTLEGYRYTSKTHLRGLRIIYQPMQVGLVCVAPGLSLGAFSTIGILPFRYN